MTLVLSLTHRCNLRCRYCYAGELSSRDLPLAYGQRAIDRALALVGDGGELNLGFFGGEPALCADTGSALLAYARGRCADAGIRLACSVTTNGTVQSEQAWALFEQPEVSIAVSCDGLPATHDRHRVDTCGRGSSATVVRFIRALVDAGRPVSVAMVVRPDTAQELADGIRFLYGHGVRDFVPTLDLWARWSGAEIDGLEEAVNQAGILWRRWLPEAHVSWFDEKLLSVSRLPCRECARCAFGNGEVAVAPSGSLYPCERLIADDRPGNPHCLPGHVTDGGPLRFAPPPAVRKPACTNCAIADHCNTYCRCANLVRTGESQIPDALLCRWNKACLAVLAGLDTRHASAGSICQRSSHETGGQQDEHRTAVRL